MCNHRVFLASCTSLPAPRLHFPPQGDGYRPQPWSLQISTTSGQMETFTSHPSHWVLEKKTPPGAAWQLFTALVKQLIPNQGAKRAVPKPCACPSILHRGASARGNARREPAPALGSVGESSSSLRPRGRAPGRARVERKWRRTPSSPQALGSQMYFLINV